MVGHVLGHQSWLQEVFVVVEVMVLLRLAKAILRLVEAKLLRLVVGVRRVV